MLPIKHSKEPLGKGLEVHPTTLLMQHLGQLNGTYWPPKTITYLMMNTPMEANMAAINNKRCDFRVFLKRIMREGTTFPKTLSTQIYKKPNLPRRTSSTVSKASSVW